MFRKANELTFVKPVTYYYPNSSQDNIEVENLDIDTGEIAA